MARCGSLTDIQNSASWVISEISSIWIELPRAVKKLNVLLLVSSNAGNPMRLYLGLGSVLDTGYSIESFFGLISATLGWAGCSMIDTGSRLPCSALDCNESTISFTFFFWSVVGSHQACCFSWRERRTAIQIAPTNPASKVTASRISPITSGGVFSSCCAFNLLCCFNCSTSASSFLIFAWSFLVEICDAASGSSPRNKAAKRACASLFSWIRTWSAGAVDCSVIVCDILRSYSLIASWLLIFNTFLSFGAESSRLCFFFGTSRLSEGLIALFVTGTAATSAGAALLPSVRSCLRLLRVGLLLGAKSDVLAPATALASAGCVDSTTGSSVVATAGIADLVAAI